MKKEENNEDFIPEQVLDMVHRYCYFCLEIKTDSSFPNATKALNDKAPRSHPV